MDSFTDQQPRVATKEECRAHWGGANNGLLFRCGLCGHRFVVGDVWRVVYMGGKGYNIGQLGIPNGLVCARCDGQDVRERFVAHWQEAVTRFWHLFDPDQLCEAEMKEVRS